MKGWMYILECSDGSYYTGSTNNLELRLKKHQNGEGANHTKKHLPVKLVYFEEFNRVDFAFKREKQIQGWSRIKKEALIRSEFERLPELSRNYQSVASTSSATENSTPFDHTQGKSSATENSTPFDYTQSNNSATEN